MQKNTEHIDLNFNIEILDAIPIATVCSDYNNLAIHVNQRFVELFGYEANEISTIYDWFIKAFPDKDYRDKVINDWQSRMDDIINHRKEPQFYELCATNKNGDVLFIEIKVKLLTEFIIYTFIDITNLKNHEEELIKNKQFLERAQQIARIGYWEINLSTKRVTASVHAKNIYGFPQDKELTFADIKAIRLPEYRNMMDEKLENLIQNNERYDVNYQIKRFNDGFLIDIHSIAEFSKNNNSIFGIIRDVTKRKKDERELFEKQERIYEILNSSPSAIACFDNELNLVFFNIKCVEVLGYSDVDVKNIYDWFILAYPDVEYRDNVIKRWNKSIQYGINRDKDIEPLKAYVKCKDGKARYIQFNTKLFSDLTLISMIDMTENKKAMDMLAESEKKFRALFENSTDAISVIKNNRHEFINPAFITMFGYDTESELIEMNHNDLVTEGYRSLVEEYTDKRIKGEEAPIYYETKGTKKDGTIFDISIKVSTYILNDEQYTLVIIRNISDRILAKQDLIAAKEKAEESDRLKSAFLANMSHEIRTPMNAIVGFSELLCDPDIDVNDLRQFTDIIHKRSDDLLVIINDILDVSRLDAKQMRLTNNDGDLLSLFNDIVEFFQSKSLVECDNIILKKNYSLSERQSYISTDFGRLKQILINLLSNAFKFTKNGFIEMGCMLKDDKTLLLYVKDSGIGIPEDKLDIIFDRFRQVEESNTRTYGGTGLGLAISKALVELFKGEIWVETEVGKGSVFYFTIPYIPIEKFEIKQEIITKKEYDWSDKTIMIIEDDEFNILFLNDVISHSKATIILATNGKEAIELYNKNHQIDIVLIDILLPDIIGYELTGEILKINKDQIIIAQTAFASEDDRRRCIKAGCKDFISKPINKYELMTLINNYLT